MKPAKLSLLPLLLALVVAVGLGCASKPDEAYENPFDPDGPDRGDPFGLMAIPAENGVIVTWREPSHPSLAAILVKHSDDGVRFTTIDTLPTDQTSFQHGAAHDPAVIPNGANYYKLQGLGLDGETSLESAVVADLAYTPPFLQVGDGIRKTTGTRFVELDIRSSTGDFLYIYMEPASTETTLADPDTAAAWNVILPWDLGPAAADDDTITVMAIVRTGDAFSDTASYRVVTRFDPVIQLAGPSNTVGTQDITLEIFGDGITHMRFAPTADDTVGLPWEDFAETWPYTLPDVLGVQTVWGEFRCDFGYDESSSVEVVADDLTDASFQLGDGSGLSSTSTVALIASAVAGEMRFSEAPDFTGVPWLPYAETSSLALSLGSGLKTVYGQFRNYFTDSSVSRQQVLVVADTIQAGFTEPRPGEEIPSKLSVPVSGFAAAANGAPPDQIEVDLGEGFFTIPPGVRIWTVDWDVPVVEENTEITLRVRATAGEGDDESTATASITVTVTPPIVPD